MDAITAFAEHVAARGYNDLPAAAIAAAKTFLLDTLGVGLIGSSGPKARELVAIQPLWGSGNDARVWSTGERLPAPAAAFCNAYQVHNAEFDCVHEAAVAHVMTVVLPVALAGAERMAKVEGKPVDGRRLIEAVVLGVDVAASLGLAATSGLRFFRPATVGVFGGSAALGRLMGFERLPPAARLRHRLRPAQRQHAGAYRGLAAARHADGLQRSQRCRRLRPRESGLRRAGQHPRRPVRLLQADRARRRSEPGDRQLRQGLAHHGGCAQTVPVGPRHARNCRRLPRAQATPRLRRVRHRGGQSLRAAARAPSRGPSAQEPDADQLRAAVCFICRRSCLPARDGRVPRLQRCRLRRSCHAGPRPPHRPGGARRRRSQRPRAGRGGGDAHNRRPPRRSHRSRLRQPGQADDPRRTHRQVPGQRRYRPPGLCGRTKPGPSWTSSTAWRTSTMSPQSSTT